MAGVDQPWFKTKCPIPPSGILVDDSADRGGVRSRWFYLDELAAQMGAKSL